MNGMIETMKLIHINKAGRYKFGAGEYVLLLYVPYRLLGECPFGRKWEKAPEGEESILFEYGDGSSLEIWDTSIENSSKGYEKGVCVRYCNQEREIYQFDVEGVTCKTFLFKCDIPE